MIEKGASQELIDYRRVGGGAYKQILDFRFFLGLSKVLSEPFDTKEIILCFVTTDYFKI